MAERLVWRWSLATLGYGQLVFVDENGGTHASLAPVYGYSPGGQRTFFEGPEEQGCEYNATFEHGLGWYGTFYDRRGLYDQGAIRALRRVLLGSRASAGASGGGDGRPHRSRRGERVRDLIEGEGCELLYLPPYSPGFDPTIPSKKLPQGSRGFLRRISARTKEALVEAIGKVLGGVTPKDARGFFAHCGYYALGQQP